MDDPPELETSDARAVGVLTPPADTSAPGSSPAPLPAVTYQPGLDGLRAVALLSIFAVHANVGLAPGGFLAVSTFFTLSGFLITALLATEHTNRGRIDLRAFWSRRARRLLPASLLAVLGISLATLLWGDSSQVGHLRGDVIGSLVYAANWRFLLAHTTYAGEFAGQSPLLHFWSLAIEEQFYLVFPLIAVVGFGLARRRRAAAFVVLGGGVVASLVSGVVSAATDVSPDRLYFRTDIRAGELLMGALVGLWWVHGGRRLPESAHRVIRVAGVVLLAAMVALIATSDYHDRFWYRGGLVAYSLVTVGVILAAVETGGPVRWLLAWRPLVVVGAISYGAYLVHWPLFMWLFTKTSASGAVRIVVGTGVSLAVAWLSHRFFELPIRERRLGTPRWLAVGGVALVIASVTVGFSARRVAVHHSALLDDAPKTVLEHIAYTAAAKGEAPTVALFGDSTSLVTSLGLATFDDTDRTIRLASGSAGLGCTIDTPAQYRTNGVIEESNPVCTGWLERWKKAAGPGLLDVAFVQFGPWEVREMKAEGATKFQTIGDPEQDALFERRLTEGLDALVAHTPVVVIATSPYIEPGRVDGASPTAERPDADPARMDRVNEIIERVAARYPTVAVLDLAGYLDHSPDDRRLRPDGVHFTDKTALELSPRFAKTLRSIDEVAHGRPKPTDTRDLFPVTRYVEPR